jgi:hypothetical protein
MLRLRRLPGRYITSWQTTWQIYYVLADYLADILRLGRLPGRTKPEERGPDGRVARAAEVLHARQLRAKRLLQLITDVHQVRFPKDKIIIQVTNSKTK